MSFSNKRKSRKWTSGRSEKKSGGIMASDYVTCKYCGVVERGHKCPHKKSRQKTGDRKSDRFRKSSAWTNKSIEIRQRDKYLCQVCLRNLYNTLSFLNWKATEVHHITPIEEDFDRRLDNDNLICLCSYHHKMAEKGDIPREVLYKIVKEIEND